MTEQTQQIQKELRVFNPKTMASDGTKGPLFTARYVGYFENPRQRKSDGKPFLSKSHQFEGEDAHIIVNSTGLLDNILGTPTKPGRSGIQKGDLVTVSYGGMETKAIKGVPTDLHKFEVKKEKEVDE